MKFTDNYDDEDDQDFDESFEEIESELMAEVLSQSNKNHEEEIILGNKKFKSDLMDKVIFICKSNWFWRFLPHSMKLKQIINTYDVLVKIIDD